MPENQSKVLESPLPKGRLYWSGGIFVFGFFCPLFIPLVTASNLSVGWKATISGLLALGIPELFTLIAAAVLGKTGFNYLKGRLFGFLKPLAPPDRVSRARYRIGLVMFVLPLILGWLLPYFSHLIPGYQENYLAVNIGGDLLFLSSLLVLGGNFWDKLRALFIHEAKAQFPVQEEA